MNSKERMMTALSGGLPDRVPVFLRDLTLGLEVVGFSTPEVCAGGPRGGYHAEKSAQAVIACRERFRHDCVVGSIHDLGLDVEALGGRTDFPERGIPRVVEEPFADKTRLVKARVPRMDTDGRLPGMLESYRLVKERIGAETAICANVDGPITRASFFRGTERLMRDFIKDPAFAQDLLDFSTETAVSHIRFLAQAGADFVFLASSVDGPVIISPKLFLEYTIPSLRTIVTTAAALNLPVVFHPHGRFTDEAFRPLVDSSIRQGITGFQFPEDCDLALAKQLWGNRISILGGVDIPTVLSPGPVERIREETRKCIDQAAAGGGYVMMPSCSIHRGDPLDHIQALVDATREFGVYESPARESTIGH